MVGNRKNIVHNNKHIIYVVVLANEAYRYNILYKLLNDVT